MNGEAPKRVSSFSYLGNVLSEDCSVDKDIAARLQKANRAYGTLQSRLWSQQGIRMKAKIKVYKAVVRATVLYGSQTWTLYRRDIHLEKFHLRCLRPIMKIQWLENVTNIEVLQRAEITGIELMLTQQKLKWVGHVARMDERRLPKQVLYHQLLDAPRKAGGQMLEVQRHFKTHSTEC